MATLINNAGVQHYANKMVLAENRKVGSKSLPTALSDIDNLIDEMKTHFDTEYGSALDMKLNNNENVFSVGTGTNVDKSSEVENSFTDVELSGNSLVAIFNLSYTTTNEVTTSYYHIGTYEPNLQLKDDVYYTLLPMNPLEYVYSVALYNKIDGEFGIGGLKTSNKPLLFKKNTSITTDILFRIYLHGNNTTIPAKTTFNFLVLEGDWTNKPIPQYFEGMKSVGEKEDGNHKIEILSRNKNLFDENAPLTRGYLHENDGSLIVDGDGITIGNATTDYININYMNSVKIGFEEPQTFRYILYDKNKKFIKGELIRSKPNQNVVEINTKNAFYIRISAGYYNQGRFRGLMIMSNSSEYSNYIEGNSNKKEILLNEPLRGLPNGVKDSIEKINGEWKIVRRCGEIILNGSEDWSKVDYNHNDLCTRIDLTIPTNSDRSDLVCNNIPVCADDNIEKENFYIAGHNHKNRFVIILPNSKLSSATIEGAKEWLSKNNATVIYLLPTPIIEDISPVTLQCWKNGTISIYEILPVETTHTVALNKPAQIKRNIEELTALRKRVQALEYFYDQVALEQAHQLSLINHSIELDYDI